MSGIWGLETGASMGKRHKLPVFDLLETTIALTFRRIPAILKVTISSALVTILPAMVLFFALIPTLDDNNEIFFTLSEGEKSFWLILTGMLVVYIAFILFCGLISTSLVRMAALGERVRLFNFNRYMWANIGSQIILGLFFFAILVFILLGLAIYAVERPGEDALFTAVVGAFVFYLIFQFYLSIRMTLLYPDAAVTGTIRPWASFRMTGRSFWRLFGLLFLAGLLSFVVSLFDEFVTPMLALIPSLDAPLWTIPQGTFLTDTLVADWLHVMLQHPFWVLAVLVSLVLQCFLIGFPYILSGVIYRDRTEGT